VLDTGLRTASIDGESQPEHAFLRSPDRDWGHVHLHRGWHSNPEIDAVDDEDEPDDDNSGLLDFQAGHGTFIAGIVRQICPDAEIHPAGVLSSFGEGSVARVRSTIRRLTTLCGPFDLVVMSFGTCLPNDDPGLFGARLQSLVGDAVAVAAAGNMRTCRPYFPAALPGVIGVGGLDRAGPAWFTNFGCWVDACAPAVDSVSTFFADVTERFPGQPDRHFSGWARWSGTSFAAPRVAGAIAQEMYLSQVSANEAWQRLSSTASLRIPDLGVVVNV
jgi:subtilisin family serine protease